MSLNEIRVHSWEELLEVIHSPAIVPLRSEEANHSRSAYIFRGMSVENWKLKTSLERLGSLPNAVERGSLRSFRKYAPPSTFLRDSVWETLAVAQHNGLPTRVLDWTVSPLIATHFATCEKQWFNEDGVIWCLNTMIHRSTFLPRDFLDSLNEEQAWLHDVKILERKYPTMVDFDRTETTYGDLLLVIEPPSLDARIANQFGILSVMNGSHKSHHDYLEKMSQKSSEVVTRIIIDKAAKPRIRDMLDQNNITERMLFPGLPGLCDWLRRYYGP
jgi:FRG domain